MNPWSIFSCPTLAVSAIYCIWKVYLRAQQKLQRTIRDRVTYMLWVIANERKANQAGSRVTVRHRREQAKKANSVASQRRKKLRREGEN
jgi:hypothetical protein